MNINGMIYGRQRNESEEHYALFVRFKKMGTRRSLETMAREMFALRPDNSKTLFGEQASSEAMLLYRLKRIAKKRNWAERINAWEADEQLADDLAKQRKFISLRKYNKELHLQLSQKILQVINAAIEALASEGTYTVRTITTKDGNIITIKQLNPLLNHVRQLSTALKDIVDLQRPILDIKPGEEKIYDLDSVDNTPEMDYSKLSSEELATFIALAEKAKKNDADTKKD